MEKIMLGTVYLNGEPREPGVLYNSGQIRLGESVPGKEIQWVRLSSGLLIADRCVCNQISWEQLHTRGLVFGTPFQIDGQFYLCRCLKVGAEDGVPNEWDAALDETGEDTAAVLFFGDYQQPLTVVDKRRNHIRIFCVDTAQSSLLHIGIFEQNHFFLFVLTAMSKTSKE